MLGLVRCFSYTLHTSFSECFSCTPDTTSSEVFLLRTSCRENRSDSLPDMIPQEAAKSFSRFFQEKIEMIRQEFNDDPLDTTENFTSSVHSSDMLSSFYALSLMWHQPCQRCKYTTSVDIKKKKKNAL